MRYPSACRRLLVTVALLGTMAGASCNKDVPDPVPNTFPVPTGTSIGGLLANDTGLSLMRAAVVRAGMMTQLEDNSRTFTLFAPDNAAFAASGIRTVADIEAMPMSNILPLVQYHLSPQRLTSAMIPSDRFHMAYPSTLNPTPTTNPLFRLSLYPSRKNGFWVNSAPVKTADREAANGQLHTIGSVLEPPARTFWDRISTEGGPLMTYLRGTILTADSGFATTDSRSLVYLLSNPASSLTLFVPGDHGAFIGFYSRIIREKLIMQGVPIFEAVNTAAYIAATPNVLFFHIKNYISAKSLRELMLYNMIPGRIYQNNFSEAAESHETLLKGESTSHPGLLYITAKFWSGQSALPTVTIRSLNNSYYSFSKYGPANQPFINGVLHSTDKLIEPW